MTKHHKTKYTFYHNVKLYGGLSPPLSDPPGVLQCTPNPRACCSHAPSTEEHRCVIFFGVEKKEGKSEARFAGQKKSVEQLSFILNTKLYGRFRSHQKTQTNYLRVLCYLPKKQTLIEIDGDSHVYK